MLVSESYVLLYYENKVYMLFINKTCLNQIKPNQILNNVIITKTKVLSTKA
jgi:hypothetical protein